MEEDVLFAVFEGICLNIGRWKGIGFRSRRNAEVKRRMVEEICPYYNCCKLAEKGLVVKLRNWESLRCLGAEVWGLSRLKVQSRGLKVRRGLLGVLEKGLGGTWKGLRGRFKGVFAVFLWVGGFNGFELFEQLWLWGVGNAIFFLRILTDPAKSYADYPH